MMKVTVRVKNKIELDQKIKDHATQKLQKLEQYFSNREELIANVLCKEYDDCKVVEVTIPTKNVLLRAEVRSESFLSAVDEAIEKLESQIRKHKSKIYSSLKRRSGVAQHYSSNSDFDLEKMQTEIMATNLVKSKSVDLVPMTIDDAVLQMEMLGHPFFIFLNVENDKIGVVYLRNDHDYGYIETNV